MYASYLDGCTRCGKCVEICTVTLVDAFDVSRSSKTVDEVVGLFYGMQSLTGDAKT